MSLRLYMDVHVLQGITDALRARKVAVVTAQEDGQAEADDVTLLARATALNAVLFTRDRDLLQICAAWQHDGKLFPGLIYAHLANRVEHLPL